MKNKAIEKARADLAEAERAYANMLGWNDFKMSQISAPVDPNIDLENDKIFQLFDQYWRSFLYSFTRIYNALKTGSRGDPKSEAWFGILVNKQRKDQLLSYIHQARNSEDHGIEEVTEKVGIKVISTDPRAVVGTDGVSVTIPEDMPVGVEFAQLVAPSVRLKDVEDKRYRTTFPVPEFHLDQRLSNNEPITIARLAVKYISEVIDEAERVFH
jgi:hypothetical protein